MKRENLRLISITFIILVSLMFLFILIRVLLYNSSLLYLLIITMVWINMIIQTLKALRKEDEVT